MDMAFYEVVINGAVAGQPMLTVLHYEITGDDDFQELSDAIRDWFTTEMRGNLVPAASLSGITVREDIEGSVGVTYPFTGGALVGTNASTDVWSLVAANVRKLTTSGARPSQGRIYQGGIPSNACTTGGSFESAYANGLADAWEQLISVSFGDGGQADMVIKASNPSAPNTVPYNPVTGMQTSLRPAKQSRRNFLT